MTRLHPHRFVTLCHFATLHSARVMWGRKLHHTCALNLEVCMCMCVWLSPGNIRLWCCCEAMLKRLNPGPVMWSHFSIASVHTLYLYATCYMYLKCANITVSSHIVHKNTRCTQEHTLCTRTHVVHKNTRCTQEHTLYTRTHVQYVIISPVPKLS